jgi:hypothetical protein
MRRAGHPRLPWGETAPAAAPEDFLASEDHKTENRKVKRRPFPSAPGAVCPSRRRAAEGRAQTLPWI